MNLKKEHEDCVARPRRLLNHNDPGFFGYPVAGVVLASGENLLTVKLEQGSEGILIEKVELDLE